VINFKPGDWGALFFPEKSFSFFFFFKKILFPFPFGVKSPVGLLNQQKNKKRWAGPAPKNQKKPLGGRKEEKGEFVCVPA